MSESKEVSTQIQQKAVSPAEKQRARMEALIHAVDERKDQLSILLRDTGIKFDKFVEVFRRALIKNPDLLKADAGSVIEACINCCTDGLLPDGRQAALVIYNMKLKGAGPNGKDAWMMRANYQPMYQGLIDIAYRSGNFKSIEARVVYFGDDFSYQLGDNPKIKHTPAQRLAGSAAPTIIASYAVAKTVNGGIFREIFEGADIAKVNAVSRATSGPGKDWPEEMARKGPVRRMWKYLPKDDRMNRIADRDNDAFDLDQLDVEDLAPAAEPERKLAPGFAPKPPAALPQGADPTMPPMDDNPEWTDDDFAKASGPEDLSDAERAAFPKTRVADPDQAPENPDDEHDADDDDHGDILTAKTWAAVKQCIRNRAKLPAWSETAVRDAAMAAVWVAYAGDGERAPLSNTPDLVEDLVAFEAWLIGSEPNPTEIDANWAIVQELSDFKKLSPVERKRLESTVEEIKQL